MVGGAAGACCVIDHCSFCIKDLRPLMDPGQALLESNTSVTLEISVQSYVSFTSRVAKQNCLET